MDKPIVFYDGVCGLCDRFVRACLVFDRSHVLSFAPLQGETAASLLPDELTAGTPSVVLHDNGTIFTESSAIIRILAKTSPLLRWTVLFLIIPPFVRDALYRLIARHRYKIFGKFDSCQLPTNDQQEQFLP